MKKHGVVFQILMSALSIVGAIVGIGFVSGKEIVSFFWRYQGLGFLLAFLSSLGLFFCVFFGAMRAKKLKQITERNLITDNQNFGDQNCDSGARFDDGKSKFDELNNQVINGCKNCKNESFGLKKCVKNENNDNINKSTVINNFDNKDCGRNNINLNNEKHDQVLKNRKINNKNIKKHIKYANIKDKFAKIYTFFTTAMKNCRKLLAFLL